MLLQITVIAVLALLGAAGTVTAVLLFHTLRRSSLPDAQPRPALGSPAQILIQRGERALGNLQRHCSDQPGLAGVVADAEQVVSDLKVTGAQVAELSTERQRVTKDVLITKMQAAVTGLERAAEQIAELLRASQPEPTSADLEASGAALTERITGLRSGLAEVQRLSNPVLESSEKDWPPNTGARKHRGQVEPNRST